MRSRPQWLRALRWVRDAVYVVNDAQRIVRWNGGAQKLLDYPESEVLHQPCYQVIGGKVCGKSWCHAGCAVQRLVRRGVPLQTFDMQVTSRDGQELLLSTCVFTLQSESRHYFIHLLRDVTRQKLTEEALEKVLDTLHAYGVTDGNSARASKQAPLIRPGSGCPHLITDLTRREIEVLELLAEGLATREIARRLGISPFTIRSHVESILLKTGLHTQAQAVAYAYRAGLL